LLLLLLLLFLSWLLLLFLLHRAMPPARKKRKHKVDAEEAQDDGAVQVDEGENDEPQEGETQEGVKKGTNHPAFAKKGWKSVQLDLDMMKEFENDGGLFFEEADPAEIGVMYLDKENLGLGPSLLCTKKVKKAKTKGKKRALGGDGAKEDLATENDRLKKELDKLKGQTQAQEEERAVVELKAWAQFDLHPKILAGLARLGFKTPTSVQARCLGPVGSGKTSSAQHRQGAARPWPLGFPSCTTPSSGWTSWLLLAAAAAAAALERRLERRELTAETWLEV